MSVRLIGLGAVLIAAWLAAGAAVVYAAAAPEQAGRESAGAQTPALPGAPRAASPSTRKPRTSDRCNTPAINCILSERQRSGSSCWCVTPFGPSYGQVP